MRYIILLSTLAFILLFNSVAAQNWFTKSYSINFTNTSSKELIDSILFFAIEGSRTDDYKITIDTSLSVIHFSFSTMGGEEASLIIENNDVKMVIAFDKFFSIQDLNAAKKHTQIDEFRSGYFTFMDGDLIELNEEYKIQWKAFYQNHDSKSIIAKTIVSTEFEK